MLHRQLIVIYLLLIFVSSFAQEFYSNNGNRIIYRHRREASPSQQSNQNGTPSANSASNSKDNNQPMISNQIQSIPLASSTLLASSSECKVDIQKYCMKNSGKLINNLKALQCIDDLDNAVNLISKECQNKIYKFKYNMTHDVHFDDTAMKVCKKDIKLLEDCNDHTDERGTGRLVSCLYDLFDNITEPSCRYFIEQIQATVFTDWRLSESFATACLADITQLKCGRLDEDNETLPHEQGVVISCLSKSHTKLTKDCLKHISRLAEMQSDDYHLDRALYYACREDRERFCSQVASGNGRVYRCLYDQKFNNLMSTACREEVHRRQELVAANALVDAPLVRACKTEMREHQCVTNPKDSDQQLTLVNLLLCLEKRIKSGNTINDDCRRQILIHRRMLMSDYAVVPEIISDCKAEMVQHCSTLYQKGASGTIDQRGGRMIHCLLGAARKEKSFSSECSSTIKSFVRAVDPGSDIRADPLLEATCRPVIDALCAKIKPGDSNVIMCLLDNLKNSRMTEDCEDRLMEVAYFMLRDWRLTPKLLGSCRKDLVSLCQFPANWTMGKEMTDVRIGKYLSCLHRQKNQLNSECSSELKRLMRIRSQSVNLMPEIEDHCMYDLANCKNPDVKGEELKCLQKKYDKLDKECQKAVKKYTEPEMKDPTLNFPLMKSCESMIQLFCSNIDNNHENDLLIRCLIKQKNNQKMDYRCKANLEHHQLVSLKDAAFLSEQFQTKCKQEIDEHCQGKKTKSGVVQCLARLMLQDVLKKTNKLKEDCRDELKFELLQRGESINFDPTLAKACQNDIHKFCGNQNPGNAQVLDCLKANRNKVSNTCFRKLKQREQTDIVQPDNDYSLTTNCAPVIQKFCANENKQNILSCLRRNANRDATTSTCRNVLYHRLMVLNSDARFNKALIDNCQNDIGKYCQGEVMNNDDDDDDDDGDNDNNNEEDENNNDEGEVKDRDMGGRIIGCLRMKYANKNADLESKCMSELANVIHDSKLDVQLDVKLYQNCKQILDTKCPGVEKEDCLKLLYQKKELDQPACKEQVIRIIKEGQADIHVDQVLAIACQTDILRYCNDIPIGGGKQLQCLIRLRDVVTNTCRNILSKRQELWSSISDIDDIDDLTRHIVHSSNNFYLYSVILLLLCLVFLAGCICRPFMRYRRISKYQ